MLVASLLIAGAFTVAFSIHRTADSAALGSDNEVRALATNELASMLTAPGKTLGGASAWNTDPDHLSSFGLTSPDTPNFLDYHKILSLRHGNLTSTMNGAPDYPDVKTAAGLNGFDFHLRTYPILKGVDDAHWLQMRGLRVAYLGHFYQSATSPTAQISVSQDTNASDHTEAHVKIDYTAGPNTDLFQVTLDIDTTDGHYIQQYYSKSMSPGDQDLVVAKFYNENWKQGTNDYTLRVTVVDVMQGQTLLDSSAFRQHLVKGTNAYNLGGTPKKDYWVLSDCAANVQFKLDTWDEEGERYKHDVATTYSVTDPSGTTWLSNVAETLTKGHDDSFSIDCTGHGYGTYTLTVKTAAVQQTMRFTIYNSDPGSSPTWLATYDDLKERTYLGTLVAGFANWTYVQYANGTGDVFRDVNNEASSFSTNQLSRYQIVVVGSGIAQNRLLGQFDDDIENWMNTTGGTLIVLGNDDNSGQWLQPLFKASTTSASGSISTPDPTHPLLHTPNELSYLSYQDYGRAYLIGSSTASHFAHVLVKSQGADGSSTDTLAVSDAGAYGDGTIVITSYSPRLLLSPQSDHEALKFMQNLLSQAYTTLFLDYGPPIYKGAVVGSSTRVAVSQLPIAPATQVEVRIVLYVFR